MERVAETIIIAAMITSRVLFLIGDLRLHLNHDTRPTHTLHRAGDRGDRGETAGAESGTRSAELEDPVTLLDLHQLPRADLRRAGRVLLYRTRVPELDRTVGYRVAGHGLGGEDSDRPGDPEDL